jgi:hypothetical protein
MSSTNTATHFMRTITKIVITSGYSAVLACGHTSAALASNRPGDRRRCIKCQCAALMAAR